MIQVRPGKPGYQADAAAVLAELTHLPPTFAAALAAVGIAVVACRDNVTDYATELSGQHPNGWPDGATWDSVPGAYIPQRKEVVIATIAGPGGTRRVPPFGVLHGSRSLAVHETVHGYDHTVGHQISADPPFRGAWSADYFVLNNQYYTDPSTGPQESFAESAAHHFGNDQSEHDAWPNLRDFWVGSTGAAFWAASIAAAPSAGSRQSIGLGRALGDGTLELYLTAENDDGAHGLGLVRVPAAHPEHGTFSTKIASHNNVLFEELRLPGRALFDVPPFG